MWLLHGTETMGVILQRGTVANLHAGSVRNAADAGQVQHSREVIRRKRDATLCTRGGRTRRIERSRERESARDGRVNRGRPRGHSSCVTPRYQLPAGQGTCVKNTIKATARSLRCLRFTARLLGVALCAKSSSPGRPSVHSTRVTKSVHRRSVSWHGCARCRSRRNTDLRLRRSFYPISPCG